MFILLTTLLFQNVVPETKPAKHVIEFCTTRQVSNGALKPALLQKLKAAFNLNIFVETGTYLGDTTLEAAKIFDEVHSIELSVEYYARAMALFKETSHVTLYQGDSGEILQDIVPTLSGTTLFYLDGHYSGGHTAKGPENTPLLEELNAISLGQNSQSVILIDDIRLFQKSCFPEKLEKAGLDHYPDLNRVVAHLLLVNPEFQICFLGDALLAFPPKKTVTVSPVVRACAMHRFFVKTEDVSLTIALAKGDELDELLSYYRYYAPFELGFGYPSYATLWFALIMREYGQLYLADELIRKASENSPPGWIIDSFYLRSSK